MKTVYLDGIIVPWPVNWSCIDGWVTVWAWMDGWLTCLTLYGSVTIVKIEEKS